MAGAIQGLDRVAPSGRLAHPTQFDQLRTAAAGAKSRASRSRMAPRTSRCGASQDSAASPSPNSRTEPDDMAVLAQVDEIDQLQKALADLQAFIHIERVYGHRGVLQPTHRC